MIPTKKLLKMLPKCGRFIVFQDGSGTRCNTAVLSSAIPCPSCQEREEADQV